MGACVQLVFVHKKVGLNELNCRRSIFVFAAVVQLLLLRKYATPCIVTLASTTCVVLLSKAFSLTDSFHSLTNRALLVALFGCLRVSLFQEPHHCRRGEIQDQSDFRGHE